MGIGDFKYLQRSTFSYGQPAHGKAYASELVQSYEA